MTTASTPIEIRGRYFWKGTERFMLRGVVYQDYNAPPGSDDIADDKIAQLEHDIGLFEELGINALLIYNVDHTKSHDRAMRMLEDAGIYVLPTLCTPSHSLNRMTPLASYNEDLLMHLFRTVDVLAAYPNVLGVLAGNEIINNRQTLQAAPVIRAVVRDVKRYLRLKHDLGGQRVLPVGYSAADVRDLEQFTRDYLSAGDVLSRIEFWAKNDYSWCSPADMQISGYNHQVKVYRDFHIPAFFSEYGANTNAPRDFGETAAMLSDPGMTEVFSGGLAYEFWWHANGYGMVKRITGRQAAKWRRAHHKFEQISVDDVNRDLAKLALEEPMPPANPDEWESQKDTLRSRRLDRNVAEYRETAVGEIVLYKDFVNLKNRLAAAKDAELNTDPDWTDSTITSARAPAFPTARSFDGPKEEDIPPTCVDWDKIEESIRDEEYVLVDERSDTI